MTPSHTPGPWIVKSEYDGEAFIDLTSDSPYSHVMPENGSWPEEVVCEVWGTEYDNEANAKLIAAAPDLLEALRQIIYMNVHYCIDKYGDSSKAESMECVKVARAAITRATGAQP